MKIRRITLENFMLFDKLEAEFSPHINIICGENSTGKTVLAKALYACAKCRRNAQNAQEQGSALFAYQRAESMKKEPNHLDLRHPAYWRDFLSPGLTGAFRPENGDILRLSNRYSEEQTFLAADFFGDNLTKDESLWVWWKRNGHVSRSAVPELPKSNASDIVYIPTREMISVMENFASLYEDYHIPFDETCYDLTRLLDRPQKKKLPDALQAVLKEIETILGGKLVQRGKTFYLDMGAAGEIEMSLISDGWRKLATILNLIGSGTLSDGSVLFWDEPETNMNPKMTQKVVNILVALAAAGVQVFVVTHDYFVQQYFGLAAEYGEQYQKDNKDLQYRFFSLNRDSATGPVTIEWADRLVDLKHNAVSEEYDALYDREMGLIYASDAE